MVQEMETDSLLKTNDNRWKKLLTIIIIILLILIVVLSSIFGSFIHKLQNQLDSMDKRLSNQIQAVNSSLTTQIEQNSQSIYNVNNTINEVTENLTNRFNVLSQTVTDMQGVIASLIASASNMVHQNASVGLNVETQDVLYSLLNATITPTSNRSRILILARCDIQDVILGSAGTATGLLVLQRDGIGISTAVSAAGLVSPYQSIVTDAVIVAVDSPASATAISYNLMGQLRAASPGNSVVFGITEITLVEIYG